MTLTYTAVAVLCAISLAAGLMCGLVMVLVACSGGRRDL